MQYGSHKHISFGEEGLTMVLVKYLKKNMSITANKKSEENSQSHLIRVTEAADSMKTWT